MSIWGTIGGGLGAVFGGIPGAVLGSRAGNAVGGGGSGGSPRPDPWSGFPEDVDYTHSWTPGMAMAPGIERELGQTKGLDRFSQEALRTGASPWARMATEQSFEEEARARDQSAGAMAGNLATARSNLAMRGGLSSGARERLESQAADDYLATNQAISAQGAQNRNQIGINDEQNRITQLGMLPGMELAPIQLMGQARQFDIQNQMRDNMGLNAYNLDNLGQKRSAWAADKTAQSQEWLAQNTGGLFGGGGFLGLGF